MSTQAPPSNTPAAQTVQRQPAEAAGLSKVMWFGIIQIVGIGVGWVISYYLFGTVFTSVSSLGLGPNPTPAQVSAALGPMFQTMTLILPVTIAAELVGLVILTWGLRDLAKVDRDRFSIPSIFMVIMVIGVVVVAAGAIPLLNSIPQIIAQVPTTPPSGTLPPAFAGMIASLFGDIALVVVGGLLALIGVIGGQILGLWRVGARYNETLVKVAAIFSIIPLLNVVAPILVLVGVHEARSRLA